ncbi:hypothetical protein HBB16_18185 [Pseudonocardia sp. MCCB 268]|nr:hypothetical protein [Pseudonocardia cytotoxica]
MAFRLRGQEIWSPWVSGARFSCRPGPRPRRHWARWPEFVNTGSRRSARCPVLDTPRPGRHRQAAVPRWSLRDISQFLRRWCRPGRRFLNVYGPTEATSATWSEVRPSGRSRSRITADVQHRGPRRVRPVPRAAARPGPGRSGSPSQAGLRSQPTTSRAKVFIRDFWGSPATRRADHRTGDRGG